MNRALSCKCYTTDPQYPESTATQMVQNILRSIRIIVLKYDCLFTELVFRHFQAKLFKYSREFNKFVNAEKPRPIGVLQWEGFA